MLLTRQVSAIEFVITENGSGSESLIATQTQTQTIITQTNDAQVTNNISTDATTGNNTANDNNGDIAITTGDIKENIEITNSLNNSEVQTPCCQTEISGIISENGSNSINTLTLNPQLITVVNINNYANITNSVTGSANTGGNTANDNNGKVEISTGNITASSKTLNSPINIYDVTVGTGGISLAVAITGNGTNSINTIEYNSYGGTSVNANNIFVLSNIIGWNLDTGNNFANGNVGDVSIKTGNIVLDILIENLGNVGYVKAGCCSDPADPDDPGDPGDPGDPTSSPTPPSFVPPGGTSEGQAGNSGAGAGGPGILGLSATTGLPFNILILIAGLGMILASYRLCKNYSLEFQFYY